MERTAVRGRLTWLAGGSGVVPLRSILRHRRRTGSDVPPCLLYSARSWQKVIYRDELGQHYDGVQLSYTLTRSQPAGWSGQIGRIDPALLAEVAWPAEGTRWPASAVRPASSRSPRPPWSASATRPGG